MKFDIVQADKGGFCFGVRRAVEMAQACAAQEDCVYTLGPIVHNPLVVERLARQGVVAVEHVEDIPRGAAIVIRSHGVHPSVLEACAARDLRVTDATCPCVARIHTKTAQCAQDGIPVVIVGEAEHPEVQGIAGWCGDGAQYIVNTPEDVEALPEMERACVVAQTTTAGAHLEALLTPLRAKVASLEEYPSICHATSERQDAAVELARKADAMVVIGGRNSSNTRKLYMLCKEICPTWWVERAQELPMDALREYEMVGITSGASTPDWIIEEVYCKMSENEVKAGQTAEEEIQAVEQPAAECPVDQPAEQAVETQTEQACAVTQEEQAEAPDAEACASEPTEPAEAEPAAEAQADAPAQEAEASAEEAPAEPKEEAPAEEPRELTFEETLEQSVRSIRPGQVLSGTVVQVSDDEVCVNIGYKADGLVPKGDFIPEGETDVDLKATVNVGDVLDVQVKKVNDGDGNVLLSCKDLALRKNWNKLLEEYEAGAQFTATGKSVVKGGIISSIYGVRAFIPASQVDVGYVNNLEQFVGEEIPVKIIEVDRHRRRVVASRRAVVEEEKRQADEVLWNELKEKENQVVRGVVRRLTDFGAFVDIGGVDGLIHVTDMTWGRVRDPKSILSVNDEVNVLIMKVDVERKRVSLGLKQTKPKPWDIAPQKYIVGDIVQGKVVRIVPFGAFVELEPDIDGLVHISQISDRRIGSVEEVLKVDDLVDVKVLDVNPTEKRISLSIREAMLPDYEEDNVQLASSGGDSEMVYSTENMEQFKTQDADADE